MDTTSFLLVNKFQTSGKIEVTDVFLYIVILPLISFCISKINDIYTSLLDKISGFRKSKSLLIEGLETLDYHRGLIYEFPIGITALTWYIKARKCLNINSKAYIIDKNGAYSFYNGPEASQKVGGEIGFIFESTNGNKINIDTDVSCQIIKYKVELGGKDNPTSENIRVIFSLYSKSIDLQNYLENIVQTYKKHLSEKSKDKLYHFIYQGRDKQDNPIFTTKILSDLKDSPNCQTFDHIFNEHTSILKRDVKRLRELEYFKRTGSSRKKGYLFFGEPGCGKTRTVQAMSNFDNRHIIEISMSRVCTNKELETILNLNTIGGVSFTPDQIIILFEEIDTGGDLKRQVSKYVESSEKDEKSNKEQDVKEKELEYRREMIKKIENSFDTLNIGILLARLDGIGNYEGLIIVATTNHKEKLDPALYRDQRLTPVHFTYSRKEDIIAMTEKFYGVVLSVEQKISLPDRNAQISPAKLKTLLDKHEDNVDNFIDEIKVL